LILQRFTANLDVFPHNNIQHYFLKYILGAVRIYGIGTNHRVYWTVPNDGSWSYLTSNPDEWIWRIVIDGDTIYGIVSDGSVYEISVHGGSWTQIAPPDMIDLAYWNGTLYGVGTDYGVYRTVPNNGSWSLLTKNCNKECYGEQISRITISFYSGTIYGIGTDGSVFYYQDEIDSWIPSGAPPDMIELASWNDRLYGIGKDNRVYWLKCPYGGACDGSWIPLTNNSTEWFSRIVIHGDTMYGIGAYEAYLYVVYEISVHGGLWTKITPPNVIDLAVHTFGKLMLIKSIKNRYEFSEK
jgi:hypothetical protein